MSVNGSGLRQDLRLIAALIEPHTRVLDVGCADGALLAHLARTKDVDARGIELSHKGVHECVSQGLAVVQGDADTDLAIYPDGSFDYVILSQTIQAMRDPRLVLENMLRIGRYGIVSFTNYAYWRARWYLVRRGRMPMARCLPDPWYSTANIHPCTLEDFEHLCAELGLRIEQRTCLAADGAPSRLASSRWLDNLFSEQALFVLTRPRPADARRTGSRRPRPAPPPPAPAAPDVGRRLAALEGGLDRGGVDLLLGGHQQHAREALGPAQAEALPDQRGAQQQARAARRHEQRARGAARREQVVAQRLLELAGAERPAMTERRALAEAPQAAPVGHHDQRLAAVGQHAPELAQQPLRLLGQFQRMDHQHAIDAAIGDRQLVVGGEDHLVLALGRPAQPPWRGDITTQTRSASSASGPRKGVAKPTPSRRMPVRSGQIVRICRPTRRRTSWPWREL